MVYDKYIVCSDSFKGCLSSSEVNAAVVRGLEKVYPSARFSTFTLSDGGEGFLSAWHDKISGQWMRVNAHDPLMRPIVAEYLMLSDGAAVIESARTCGLCLLKPDELNPLRTTSYGLGEIIANAVLHDCQKLVIGLGGTCTNDYGQGMLDALQHMLPTLDRVLPTLPLLHGVQVVMATDVDNPLFGPHGAAVVFAPQKGATADMVKALEERGRLFVRQSQQRCGHDCSMMPSAGAAGGIGYALMQYLHAEKQSGVSMMLDLCGFDETIGVNTCVITGEGHADRQTLMGKLPFGVLQRAKPYGATVWLIAGSVDDRQQLLKAGFDKVFDINAGQPKVADILNPSVARRRIEQLFEER